MRHTHLEIGHFGYLFYPLSGLRLKTAVLTYMNTRLPALLMMRELNSLVEFLISTLLLQAYRLSSIRQSPVLLFQHRASHQGIEPRCIKMNTGLHQLKYTYMLRYLASSYSHNTSNTWLIFSFLQWWRDSNPRLPMWQTGALTNWTTPLFLWISDRL